MAAACSSSSPCDKPKKQGHCLKPRVVLERSFVNSVTELVCNAMPNQSSSTTATDKVKWLSFVDECDLCDPSLKDYLEKIVGPELPVLAILSYSGGFQVWALLCNGECEELLSVWNGPVSCVNFLPSPKLSDGPDEFALCRPLMAVCDDSGPQSFSSVNITSLKQNGRSVRRLNYEDTVVNILTSDRALIVTFIDKIVILDPVTLKERFWIKNCYNELNPNSISLSSCWLAYPDLSINPTFQSCGGASGYDDSSYTSQVVSAAKNLSKTVSEIGASLATMTGVVQQRPRHHSLGSKKSESLDKVEGVVTIISVDQYDQFEVDLQSCPDSEGILAHFLVNVEEPVAYTKFNRNGTLLLTSGPSGRAFDVFLILPHPSSPCLGAVQHLYVLQRGATVAKILDLTFSPDSRWVAVSTANGTTHLFPITPYGGPVNVRTHSGQKVVNRESRFHRSAGLESLEPPAAPAIHHSASSCSVYSSLKPKEQHPSTMSNPQGTLYRTASNPRLPPYNPPLIQFATAKVRQPSHLPPLADSVVSAGSSVVSAAAGSSASGVGSGGTSTCQAGSAGAVSTVSTKCGRTLHAHCSYRQLATVFAPGRGVRALGSPSQRNDVSSDCLYILRSNGQLGEYQMIVKPLSVGSRVSDENPIELSVIPTVEWPLIQCKTDQEIGLPAAAADYDDNVIVQAATIKQRLKESTPGSIDQCQKAVNRDLWISQVEIVTYSGPHRRLWMGPQFTFKTYLDSQRSASLTCPTLPVRVGSHRSEPVAIGYNKGLGSSLHSIPVVIEASSTGSFDHIPPGPVMEVCGSWSDNDYIAYDEQEGRLRKSLAEAMAETSSSTPAVSNLSSEDLSTSDRRRRYSSSRDNQLSFGQADL